MKVLVLVTGVVVVSAVVEGLVTPVVVVGLTVEGCDCTCGGGHFEGGGGDFGSSGGGFTSGGGQLRQWWRSFAPVVEASYASGGG